VTSVKTAVARRNFVNGVDGTDGTVAGLGVPNGIFSP
jgi:hypothetical protein